MIRFSRYFALVVMFALACGDDDSTMDAGQSDAAGRDVSTADTIEDDVNQADVNQADAGQQDAAPDVPAVDAGPPPPVERGDDGFVVRDAEGNEFSLCGCSSDALPLSLGPTLATLVNRPVHVFFDNLIAGDGSEYRWSTYAAEATGDTLADEWTFLGDAPLSDEVFIVAWDDEGTPVGVGATTLSVSAADAGAGLNPTILFLGDSTTAGGVYARAMLDLFDEDPMGATTVGTVVTGRASHEGRSGWKISDYFDDSRGGQNPFYSEASGGFDYAHYLAESGLEAPDYFFVHLGINDVFTIATDDVPDRIARMLTRLDGFFENILSVAPETEIAIGLTIVPCATESGFTANYMGSYTRANYKPRIAMWARLVIEHYRERDVHLVPLNATIDSWNGFPNEPEGEGIRHTNAVHPNSLGYGQMGETIYSWLKAQY